MMRTHEDREPYWTDLSDAEWQIIEPLVPAVKEGGRPADYSRREVVNAIRYLNRTGCAWRLLPHDLPPYRSVFAYFAAWQADGTWELKSKRPCATGCVGPRVKRPRPPLRSWTARA